MPKDCNVTTIVYRNGELATDSKIARHMDTSLERYTVGEKVYKSPCGRAYFAKPGQMYEEASFAELSQEILLQLVIMLDLGTPAMHFTGLQHIKEEILVVTRDSAFHIEYGVISQLDSEDFCTMGSGVHIAKAPLLVGATPSEAVMFTLDRDRLSGGPVRKYMSDKLKPLTVAVKAKRTRKTA
jgi:hypothetical protein